MIIRRLRNTVLRVERISPALPVAGTGSPSVLRRRVFAPYVPLRTRCSESVPATGSAGEIRSTRRTVFRKRLIIILSYTKRSSPIGVRTSFARMGQSIQTCRNYLRYEDLRTAPRKQGMLTKAVRSNRTLPAPYCRWICQAWHNQRNSGDLLVPVLLIKQRYPSYQPPFRMIFHSGIYIGRKIKHVNIREENTCFCKYTHQKSAVLFIKRSYYCVMISIFSEKSNSEGKLIL